MILSPSILAADFLNLGEEVRIADKAGCPYIHVDVMDGVFVPSISFGTPILSAVRAITKKVLDVHLMVVKPEKHIDEYVKNGADIITFHMEACDAVEETIGRIKAAGLKAGIALSPSTPIEAFLPYMESADMVLVMTVQPGRGGQKLIDSCKGKIRAIRELSLERGLSLDIEVDGGINRENATLIAEAGANVIVAGSAVFEKDHTAENIKYFLEKFKEIEQTRERNQQT